MDRETKLLLLLAALAGAAAWLWLTESGKAFAQSAGSATATGAEVVRNIWNLAASTLDLVKGFEGFSATPYRDAGGYSIGYGHFMGATPTINYVTEEQATDLAVNDLIPGKNAINTLVKVPINRNQFDALASFIYNIGVNAFASSTLLKKLNAGDFQGAAAEFLRWNKSGGVVLPALVARRNDESQLFMS